jgi:hypothetical protein
LDWQASAAATLGSFGFSPFRKRPARGVPLAGGLAGWLGGAAGRVVGIVTPCVAMHALTVADVTRYLDAYHELLRRLA